MRAFAHSRCYNLKLYENNNLIHNFIPCYRKSDSEIGLYDLVTKSFFTGNVLGEFEKGEDIIGTTVLLRKAKTAKVPITSVSINNANESPINGNINIDLTKYVKNDSTQTINGVDDTVLILRAKNNTMANIGFKNNNGE